MDVDSATFWARLPHMLSAIRDARFVAIDVEMTGISLEMGPYQHTISTHDAYVRAKKAAEAYQVAQIGLTCCHYEEESSKYTTTSFNCSVSPLFPRGRFSGLLTRSLNRKFSVAATSFSFLRDNKMCLFGALENGVHYLRRDEQQRALQLCREAQRTDEQHINVLELDEPSRTFYEECRAALAARDIGTTFEPTIITSQHSDKLNGLQIRLVKQLIREEFPRFKAIKGTKGTMGFMFIRRINEGDKVQTEAWGQANIEKAEKLAGLRIVLEALTGGSFAQQAHLECTADVGDRAGVEFRGASNEKFDIEKCEADLKKRRPVLVGHNMLYDLVFIYNTFFGPLPDGVDDFLHHIHELFPRIVDTKYMHTRGHHMMDSDMSLKELHRSYEGHQFPSVAGSAILGGDAHHAGYDSSITMSVFLRQAHSMYRQEQHLVPVNETIYRPKTTYVHNNDAPGPISRKSEPSPSEPASILDLDNDEEALINAIRKWTPLEPERKKRSQPLKTTEENYSEKEIHILPPWSSPFWDVYGNKTRVAGAGAISFV
ncbi:ribonuclease H-like domain-containing protein [Biscogniauxia marginata]|nr:ribonuclease H-like domain-containing protein [Biscogniauxia marginata]